MISVNVYLLFNGNCAAAFDFYRSVLGGEFITKSLFNEMPPQEGFPPMSEEDGKRVMHISMHVGKDSYLMGSDTGGEWAKGFSEGNNFSLSLGAESREEADRVFKELSEGGEVKMPMADTFWGSYFGMWTDKFGINWQMSYDVAREGKH